MRRGKLGNAPGSDQHFTPPEILDRVEKVAPIVYDPCSHALAPVYRRTLIVNQEAYGTSGLETVWGDVMRDTPTHGLFYTNPPFSDIEPWADRAVGCYERGYTGIVLVPVRTSQPYWDTLMRGAAAVAYWQGNRGLGLPRRVRFWAPGTPGKMDELVRQPGAPFDTALVLLTDNREHRAAFCEAFADVATIVVHSTESMRRAA